MSDRNSVVAVFETHAQAGAALKELHRCGFDVRNLSIAGKDYHAEEAVVAYYNAGDRMKRWGASGAFWGGMWALLHGSGLFMIPGTGPILVAGPLVTWVIGALDKGPAESGLNAIGAGLHNIGIPKGDIVAYEAAIKSDKYVVVVHGTVAEVQNADRIITASHPEVCRVHAIEQKQTVVAVR